jgi:aspartyl-tRNA(Asn)/glutamyl-tRNA(Gln) amidotransferase subunit B
LRVNSFADILKPVMDYETIIGLEVHVQLLTKSKMYCGCSADIAGAAPNTFVCPVCLGMPGVLPVINQRAVEFAAMTALALNCTISEHTKFDRKNYPYPDLMKGYQISQYDEPIGVGGWLTVDVDDHKTRIGITRVHLEEDVARLVHRTSGGESYSLVDVNRAGVPLMEIVGEPDIRSPEEARQYLVKLRSILQYLGVSTGNMEEGSFRCDANISIRPLGSQTFMSKVEVKNMNSFRAVYLALEYEAKRQRSVIEQGERLVQETRGWVDEKGITFSQRSKEYAHDYRYFPEPDLPPLRLSREWVEEMRAKLPELPEARRDRFMREYGLPLYDANLLTGSKPLADYFEELKRAATLITAKDIGNWLLGTASGIMNASNTDISEFDRKVSATRFAELLNLESKGNISSATAKSVLEEMYRTGQGAGDIITRQGLGQINDSSELEKAIIEAIKANPLAVADYHAGKTQSVKFLMGQVMRATKGRANPALVGELLEKKLKEN